MKLFHQWRLRSVPVRLGRCTLCACDVVVTAVDYDLRGDVCGHCFPFLRGAEEALRRARIAAPADSILEGGNHLL